MFQENRNRCPNSVEMELIIVGRHAIENKKWEIVDIFFFSNKQKMLWGINFVSSVFIITLISSFSSVIV